jgi:hypothetical protein
LGPVVERLQPGRKPARPTQGPIDGRAEGKSGFSNPCVVAAGLRAAVPTEHEAGDGDMRGTPSSVRIKVARSMLRLTLALALLLAGCQALSPQEGGRAIDQVRIVEDESMVANCAEVGRVMVAPPFPFLKKAIPEASIGTEETKRDLRYQARLAGGNTVLRTGMQEGMTLGTAYDCE